MTATATEYQERAFCAAPKGWRAIMCAHGEIAWAPNRCRGCEGCQTHRRRTVTSRIMAGLEGAGESAAMLTLTSKLGSTNAQVMLAWNRFRGWLRRRLPQLEYVLVKERGSLHGMLHLHVIVRGWTYIDQHELSRAWERYSGAFRVDIRRLYGPAGAAAYYAAKYVAKALGMGDLRKLVTYSKGWPKREPQEGAGKWRLTSWRHEGAAPPATDLWPDARWLGSGLLVLTPGNCSCVSTLDTIEDPPAIVTAAAARTQARLVIEGVST